ncbi:MAG: hypothetical protein ACXADB_11445 [Candidatus Hermodarchaeia archaeon]|jgi:hypothetical protein
MAIQQVTGKVIKKKVSEGSKSERDAVLLVTDDGEHILQRQGGNPFNDRILNVLVGKTITCEGFVHKQKFIMSAFWEAEKKNE